jgi:hypothetical protein
MSFLSKIFDKLIVSMFNRKNSPSIKAGGNITAGGNIIVGDKNISKKSVRAGLLEEGKNSTYIGCEMEGPDYGMIDRGKNTTVIDSKMRSNKKHD